jgi:hypothetical protein
MNVTTLEIVWWISLSEPPSEAFATRQMETVCTGPCDSGEKANDLAGASTRADSIARRNACVPSTFPFTAAIAARHQATQITTVVDRLLTRGKSRGILVVGVQHLRQRKAVLILASIVGIVITVRAPRIAHTD